MNNDLSKQDQEDLFFLLEELSEVNETLRDISHKVLRIERRVKAVLPPPQGGKRDPKKGGRAVRPAKMDEQTARQLIGQLKESAAKGEQIERQLRGHPIKPDLQAIARVLGMTNVKLPPKDELIRRISSRLRQSVAVSTGIRDGAHLR